MSPADETEIIAVDKKILDKIARLLHGINNHAAAVCGFIDIGCFDINHLKKSSIEMFDQLKEVNALFSQLMKEDDVGTVQDDSKPV